MSAPSGPGRPEPSEAQLPDGYRCRAPRRGDAGAIVALTRAEEVALGVETDANEEEVLADWRRPRFSPERDTWLIEAPGGRTAGDAWVWDARVHAELWADFHVDPEDPHRQPVRAHLLAHIEARSREHRVAAGGSRVLVGIPVNEGHDEKLDLLTSHGFAETRRFFRMRIDLGKGYARPDWPDGIEIRDFRRGRDEAPVHQALEEAFADHFRFAAMTLDEWERHTFARGDLDTGLWLVASDSGEVAATCLAFDSPDWGYVDDLAVRKPWRGRGLGLALLLESFARLEARGQTAVELGVDSENTTGAVALYERAGMRVDTTRLFMEKEVGGLR